MAAGALSCKTVGSYHLAFTGGKVYASVEYDQEVEDRTGAKIPMRKHISVDLGTAAAWLAKTGQQMQDDVSAAIKADAALVVGESVAVSIAAK